MATRAGEYLEKRQSLQGLVVLMDIRHPLKDLDQQMIQWAVESNIQVLVLLTKADKLASGVRKAQLNMVREAVLAFNGDVQVEAFSSLKKQGVDKLRQKLDSWFSELAPVEEIQDGNNHPLCRMAPLRVLSGLRCERNFSYAQ